MGMSFSCPLSDDLDRKIESLLVKQISLNEGDVRAVIRSVSFNSKDSESAGGMKNSFGGSGKMILEGSLSFKGGELETKISIKSPSFDVENLGLGRPVNSVSKQSLLTSPMPDRMSKKTVPEPPSTLSETGSNRYLAALKLQKTYKSFRTRRQLADCAVLVEQRWWKLLDFAELKRTSVSFFDIERPETAFSRWSRARTRAAKVGKGLSKDEKARKLALQHWLEAIDPRHRYGHNLQFYYINWLQCESRQPFFYWLDIGEGREVNLEKCPRSKLQQQCIKYLGPIEREAYQVDIEDGKFMYKQSRQLIDTRGGPEDAKWIFVLSVSKALYVGMKRKGTFQHSSFLAGGATLSAGRLVVEDGVLKAVWPHSGHYLPTEENFEEFISFLTKHKVDVTKVERAPDGEEDESIKRKPSSVGIRNSQSEPDLSRTDEDKKSATSDKNKADSDKKYCQDTNSVQPLVSRRSRVFHSKIAALQIPKKEDVVELLKKQEPQEPGFVTPSEDAYETAEEIFSDSEFSVSKENLFDEDSEEEYEEPVPKEKILKRINSHKGMKSLQLGAQLSCRWTTGAGPRIGCVRDYPSELQARGLELVNLSPRTSNSPRKSMLSNVRREAPAASSPLGSHRAGSPLGSHRAGSPLGSHRDRH